MNESNRDESGESRRDADPREPSREQRGERFESWMRIRRGSDFDAAYRAGGRARGPWFTIVAAPNGLGHSRLGLSIGKRAWRRAVPRNRLRRVLREAFRLCYSELPAGFDLIAVGSTPEARPSLEEVRAELVRLAREAQARRGRRGGSRRRRSRAAEGPAEAGRSES